MRQSHLLLTGFFAIGLSGFNEVYAQAAVLTAGGEASGSGGTASYSVGYLVYTPAIGTGGTVTTGPQQPLEIFRLASATVTGAPFSCALYPNPTVGRVTLILNSGSHKDYSFQLYDALGRALVAQPLNGTTTLISLEQFPANTYLLRVIGKKKDVQVFKIIKN